MANKIRGLHLLIDGKVDNPTVFSESNLNSLIKQTVKNLNMDLILGPIFKAVELDPSKLSGDIFQDEGGVSGFCMISTSHISIHVWPLRQVFMMDIFSCRDFDSEQALDTIRNYLSPTSIQVESVYRSPEVDMLPQQMCFSNLDPSIFKDNTTS